METIIVLMQVGEEAEQDKTPGGVRFFRAGEGRGNWLKLCGFFFLFLSFRKEMSSILLRKIATEFENEGRGFS
jgi:hypothetical protein